MFRMIQHKLNKVKSNHSTIVRQIDTINENVLNPLVTNHHEGIYGFESVNFGGICDYYTIAPSSYDDVLGEEAILDYDMLNRSIDHLHCYSVELRLPSLFPIQTNELPLFEHLFRLNYPNVSLFTQFLIYNDKVEKENWHDQYEHYLRGNDYPPDSKVCRLLQEKTLLLIDKVRGLESGRKRVRAIENKMKDDGYWVSFRIILHSDSDEDIEIVENEIQEILSTRNYFNELVLLKHKNKVGYLEQYVNRKLDIKYAPVLSETELFSLFMVVESGNVNSTVTEQSNITNLRTFGDGVDINHSVSQILPKSNVNNNVIYLSEVLENDMFKKYAKDHPLPFCFGVDEHGELLLGDLTELKHLLVVGATGSGKSKWENQFILTLLLQCQPSELEMHLIDPKLVEFAGFEGFPQVKNVITDMNKVQPLLDKIIEEMDKRYEFLRSKRYKSMVNYNQDHPKSKKPYIVIVVDEYADLKMTNPEIEDYIQRIGQKARAAGIHLVIATQRPEAKVISGIIKANLPSKVSFRCDSSVDYRTVYGKNQPYNLQGKGDGVARLEGYEQEFMRFQSHVITLDEKEEDRILEKLKDMMNGGRYVKEADDTVIEETPKDKLKRIILETGELRIGQLQKEMKIRINDVTDLMKELVDDGFLVQEGRSYKLAEGE